MTSIIKGIGLVVLGIVIGMLTILAQDRAGGTPLAGIYNQVGQTFPSLVVGTNDNATTSTRLGKACITMIQTDGTTVYWYANTRGNLATSTGSCN